MIYELAIIALALFGSIAFISGQDGEENDEIVEQDETINHTDSTVASDLIQGVSSTDSQNVDANVTESIEVDENPSENDTNTDDIEQSDEHNSDDVLVGDGEPTGDEDLGPLLDLLILDDAPSTDLPDDLEDALTLTDAVYMSLLMDEILSPEYLSAGEYSPAGFPVSEASYVADVGTDGNYLIVQPEDSEVAILESGAGDDIVLLNDNGVAVDDWYGDDAFFGGDGDDTIFAYDGNDTVFAGAGDDQITNLTRDSAPADQENLIFAGDGNDTVLLDHLYVITAGTNTVSLGNGDDSISTDLGTLIVSLGEGADTVSVEGHGFETDFYHENRVDAPNTSAIVTDFNPEEDVLKLSVITRDIELVPDQWIEALPFQYAGYAHELNADVHYSDNHFYIEDDIAFTAQLIETPAGSATLVSPAVHEGGSYEGIEEAEMTMGYAILLGVTPDQLNSGNVEVTLVAPRDEDAPTDHLKNEEYDQFIDNYH